MDDFLEGKAFLTIGKIYFQSIDELWKYIKYSNWFIKLITFPVFLVYGTLFSIIGVLFYILIIFDLSSFIIDKIRQFLFNSMEKLSKSTAYSFFSFLISPVILIILSFLFFLALLIPKLSNTVKEEDEKFKYFKDIFDATGLIEKINRMLWDTIKNIYFYFKNVSLILKIFLLPVLIFHSIVLFFIGLLFFIFIPLDWISNFLEMIRERLINRLIEFKNGISENFFNFLLNPIELIFSAPLLLGAYIIPKINIHLDSSDD